jgi:hypothetical protein
MAVETAADLESFFEEEEFAEAAVYLAPRPGAVAVPCSVIVDRGQGRAMFKTGMKSGAGEFAGSERHLWVRSAELATVARDGVFTVGAEVFAVLNLPKLDQTGRLWSVELLIRD